MSVDRDRIQEANEAIDRRARQRHAAALAQQELTPEAVEAERLRQLRNAALTVDPGMGEKAELVSEAYTEEGAALYEAARDEVSSLSDKLNAALQPVVEAGDLEPEIIGIGRLVFQWILVPAGDDYQLAIQLQVDEQPPAGFEADLTQEQLSSWARGKGLQGNRVEHKQFVQALFDRAIGVGATETANNLIYTLERLIVDEVGDGRNWGRPHDDPPTETFVGEDEVLEGTWDEDEPIGEHGPFADAPENADEVPEG